MLLHDCNRNLVGALRMGCNEEPMPADSHDKPGEDDAFFEAVRKTAYFLWEQEGRPHGRHDEYYLRALDQHRRERRFDEWLKDVPGA